MSMKLIEVPIGGQRYYARFSTRILVALEERSAANGGSGDPQEELNSIMASGKMSALFWLLAQMLEAGRKAAEMEGLTPPPAITYDELLDKTGLEDYDQMFTLVSQAIYTDSKTTVQTEPAKNGEATPEQ